MNSPHPALKAAVKQLPALVSIAVDIVASVNANAAKTVEVLGNTAYMLIPNHLKANAVKGLEVVQ